MRPKVAGQGFLTEPVDVITVTEGRDERGDPTEETTTVRTCGRFAPTGSKEMIGSEPWSESDAAYYLASTVAITASSRLSIPCGPGAGLWEVVGVHNWGVGLEVKIRRATCADSPLRPCSTRSPRM